jgi:hypothetical protein
MLYKVFSFTMLAGPGAHLGLVIVAEDRVHHRCLPSTLVAVRLLLGRQPSGTSSELTAKSASSNTWRSSSSTSDSGQWRTQSSASARDATSIIVNPAITSFVSTKGPSVTVGTPPENRMRAPRDPTSAAFARS